MTTTQKDKSGSETELFHSLSTSDEGSLTQQAAQHIRDLLINGNLHPGDRLPSERDLGELLGVSRTVVREAIKLLTAEGVLRVQVGVGSFIAEPVLNVLEGPMQYMGTSFTRKIDDLYQVREILEPAIAALAAQSATPEQITRLEQVMKEMEQNKHNGIRYIEADAVFHAVIAEATQNSVIVLLAHSIVNNLQEARRLAISSPGSEERASAYHLRIYDAIKNGDSDAAFKVMQEHMRQSKQEIDATLKSNPIVALGNSTLK